MVNIYQNLIVKHTSLVLLCALLLYACVVPNGVFGSVDYGGNSPSPAPTGYSTGSEYSSDTQKTGYNQNTQKGGSFVFPTVITSMTRTGTGSLQITSLSTSSLTASNSKFYYYSYLKPGIWGNEVVELQKFLISNNYMTGPVTGYFGQKTYAGVKKFQKDHNIMMVGFVGPITRGALNALLQ